MRGRQLEVDQVVCWHTFPGAILELASLPVSTTRLSYLSYFLFLCFAYSTFAVSPYDDIHDANRVCSLEFGGMRFSLRRGELLNGSIVGMVPVRRESACRSYYKN